jgi:hypothetical protein
MSYRVVFSPEAEEQLAGLSAGADGGVLAQTVDTPRPFLLNRFSGGG